jgi:protocatechuate 3,4-dioxygenase beta subunit
MTAHVVTDQADYAPGATAHILASDFAIGETVQFQVLHIDGTPNTGHGHEPWEVTDGVSTDLNGDGVLEGDLDGVADGNIATTWYVHPDDSADSAFELSATGLSSGDVAYHVFTDDGSGTPTNIAGNPFWSDVSGTNPVTTITAPAGFIITKVAIKSGNGAFGVPEPDNVNPGDDNSGDQHSGVITVDGTYGTGNGFTVSGLGTGTVTVTKNTGTKDISHVDYFRQLQPTGAIRGIKFQDNDGNGIKNGSDAGLSGWTIELDKDANGTVDATTVTGAGGTYSFTGLTAGVYRIREVGQVGWIQTTANPADVIVVGGTNSTGNDFGNFQLGVISGQKFQDNNGDGVKNGSDAGLAGWTIELDKDANGTVDATTVTVAGGTYSFTGLTAGTYRIREVGQAGWIQTTVNPADVTVVSGTNSAGKNFGNFQLGAISGQKFQDNNGDGIKNGADAGLAGWTIELDKDANGTVDATTVTGAGGAYSFTGLTAGTYRVREVGQPGWTQTTVNPGDITVVSGTNSTGNDFGNVFDNFQLGAISGLKFQDNNGDGVQNGSDAGIAGWTIELDKDANGTVDATTITGAGGAYSFTGLTAGTYRVREVGQAGWIQTTDNPANVTVVSGTNSVDNNFGNFQLGSISGQKFNDINGDGIKNGSDAGLAGWTIQLDKDANGTVDATTVTGAGGAYSFTGLTAGTYRVREVGQTGWIQTTVNPGDVTVVSGTNSAGISFGNFQLGKISGQKFHDIDGDGVKDAGEGGLVNWTIQLDKDADGTVDATTTTNASGNYSFTGLTAGTYRIREVNQVGWIQTTVNPADVTVVSGTSSTGNDFGNKRRQIIVIGPDKGNTSLPLVKIVDRETGEILKEFLVYESTFRGGVRIATGNMDGDALGIDEIIVAPGQGRVGEVRVFTQAGVELKQFSTKPYGSSYSGGVEVAVGDVNGDGKNDIVTTNSNGRTDVRVFYNNYNPAQPQLDPIPNTANKQFYAFSSSFLGGADVIVADIGKFLNGTIQSATTPDGKAEIIVGSGPGMRATMQVYDVSGTPKIVDTILPFSGTFKGGITLSAARVNADAIPDLIVASGLQGGSAVEIWSGVTNDSTDVRLSAFTTFANTTTKNMPVHAAPIDSDGDGDADVISVVQGTNGTSNQIRSFSTTGTLLQTLNGFVGPWNIATLVGLDPNLTSGFTITLEMSGLSANVQALFNQAKARWEQIIVGDLPNANYQGQFVDDVLIHASAVPLDGILGQGGPDAFREGSQLPYHGVVELNTAYLGLSNNELLSVILHEIGHVLGIGSLWSGLNLLTGAGTANPLFVGAQATAAYNQIFGTTATGVPVHNADGASRDSHWLESALDNELMTAFAEGPGISTPLSRISVASLADLGYVVNLAAADPYTKPAGTATLLAQPSSGGGTYSKGTSRLYSRIDTAAIKAEISLPSRPSATSVPPVRRPALSAASTRFDTKVVDAALTAAYQRRNVMQSDDVFVRDESDVADFKPSQRGQNLRSTGHQPFWHVREEHHSHQVIRCCT